MVKLISKTSKGFYALADQIEAVFPKERKNGEWDLVVRFKSGWHVAVDLGKVSPAVAYSISKLVAKEVFGEDAVKDSFDVGGVIEKVIAGGEIGGGDGGEENKEEAI